MRRALEVPNFTEELFAQSIEEAGRRKLPFENLVALIGMSCGAVPVSPGEAVEKLAKAPPRGAEKR